MTFVAALCTVTLLTSVIGVLSFTISVLEQSSTSKPQMSSVLLSSSALSGTPVQLSPFLYKIPRMLKKVHSTELTMTFQVEGNREETF